MTICFLTFWKFLVFDDFSEYFWFELGISSETIDLLDFPLHFLYKHKGKSIKLVVSEGNSKFKSKIFWKVIKNHFSKNPKFLLFYMVVPLKKRPCADPRALTRRASMRLEKVVFFFCRLPNPSQRVGAPLNWLRRMSVRRTPSSLEVQLPFLRYSWQLKRKVYL